MTENKDAIASKSLEILDLDEPEETQPAAPEVAPPPDWDPGEPMIIDVDGYIHVRGGRFFPSRVVGRVRGESAEATMASLMNRFQELEERFQVLQREVKGSRNLVRSLKSATSFVHWVEGADAIGDFCGLLEQAHAIAEDLEERLERSRSTKSGLIARAEELGASTAWSDTAKIMDELMEAWKAAGSGGGDKDDELWERFRDARNQFFSRRSEYMTERKKSRTSARRRKQELIEQSAALASSTDWEQTFTVMQDIMEEWKKAGSAGRKIDDELWERFREVREPFFAARRKHFAQQRRPSPRRGSGQEGGRRVRSGGERDSRPPQGSGRTRSTGTLHASLAEILGPMKDLFPEDGEGKKGAKEPKRNQKRR